LGGCNTSGEGDNPSTTVQFARVNSDGTTGTWGTTTALPVNNCSPAATGYNGYIYVHGGGNTGASDRDKIFYAKPNADGTITSWITSTTVAPVTNIGGSRYIGYNGYLYEIGVGTRDIYRIKLNSDGSFASTTWTAQTNWYPVSEPRTNPAVEIVNGYLYSAGGSNPGFGEQTAVYYGRINADGSINTATATSALPGGKAGGMIVVANGYLYYVGTDSVDNWYAQINSDGTLGSWATLTGSLPAARGGTGVFSVNNAIIEIGGFFSGGGNTNVYYTNLSRVRVGGGLDLLSYSGEGGVGGVVEGNSGGQLSAGNTLIAGTLTVTSSASIKGNTAIGGSLNVNGISSIQTTTNDANAFRLTSAEGYNILRAGTVGDTANLVIDGSVELGTNYGNGTRWTTGPCGGSETLTRVQTQAYSGSSSFEVISNSGSSTCGLAYSFPDGGQSLLSASTTYTASAYVKLTSGTTGDILVQYTNGVTNTDCNPVDATPVTGAWKHIYCTFTTTGTAPTDSKVRFLNSTTNNVTWYIDDVQISQASSVGAYFDGTLDLDATKITSAVMIQSSENSTTALQVLNASNIPQFTVDSANSRTYIGGLVADSTGALLVLDTKNTSGDPTGVNGGMYYNSNSSTFRCFENAIWYDCISRHKIVLASDVVDNTGVCTNTDITGLNFSVTSGRSFRFYALIDYSANATSTGAQWTATVPTNNYFALKVRNPTSGASDDLANINTSDGGNCSASSAATSGNPVVMEGIIEPTTSGTVQLRMASELNGSAITAEAGSTLEWW